MLAPLAAGANDDDDANAPRRTAIAATAMLDFTLPQLDSKLPFALSTLRGRTVFISFFEPDCTWCLKQMRALHALVATDPAGYAAVAVGVGGPNSVLRQWALKVNTNLPLLRGTAEFQAAVGGITVTPYNLVFDTNGRYLTRGTGYLTVPQLRALAERRNPD